MFRARNDFEGLTKDIIDATRQTARFNETTGEMMIDPMELHRLREVASATGMPFEELAMSAKETAKEMHKISKIKAMVSEDDKKFIASMATWYDDKKEYQISIPDDDKGFIQKNISELHSIDSSIIKTMRNTTQSLKDNAKQALTFNDTWDKSIFDHGLIFCII